MLGPQQPIFLAKIGQDLASSLLLTSQRAQLGSAHTFIWARDALCDNVSVQRSDANATPPCTLGASDL